MNVMDVPPPLVTIALPVYNGEQFLGEALQSLLGQTFKDFELLIGDNGSTDGTRAICEAALGDPRVRYLRSPTNRGASWNYNRLFPLARGKYFKWAAHDDVYDRLWLERCVEALDADEGVVLAYTRTIEIDASGSEFERYRPLPYAQGTRADDRLHDVLSKRTRCFEAFGVARRDVLAGTGLVGPYTNSDLTLILELALRGRFFEVPDYLFLHRQHDGRSMRVYPDARYRLAWFEPPTATRRVFPTWRLLREYGRAIGRAPISPAEKLRSGAYLMLWVLRHAAALRNDLSRANRSPVRFPVAGGDAGGTST